MFPPIFSDFWFRAPDLRYFLFFISFPDISFPSTFNWLFHLCPDVYWCPVRAPYDHSPFHSLTLCGYFTAATYPHSPVQPHLTTPPLHSLSLKTVCHHSQAGFIILLDCTESRNTIPPGWIYHSGHLFGLEKKSNSVVYAVDLYCPFLVCGLACALLHERSGYTTLPPHQVWHTDGGVLRRARRERRAARAIFKATMRVVAEVGSDAALCCTPADVEGS